jgi:hypothetical protein
MSTAAAAAAILCSYSGMIGGSVRFPSLSRRSLRGSFLVLLLRLLLLPLLLPLLLLLLLLLRRWRFRCHPWCSLPLR